MKKLSLLPTALIVASCIGGYISNTTQQDVSKIAQLETGMSVAEVIEIIGEPAGTQFSGSKKAFHYCKTGYDADEFAVVVFENEKVIFANNYNINSNNNRSSQGDCSEHLEPVELD